MKIKTLVLLIIGGILLLIVLGFGYSFFMNKTYKPGIKNLANKNIGIFYCSYGNDQVNTVVDMIAAKLKADKVEIKPAVPYPTDKESFKERIKQENQDLSKVTLGNGVINLSKYNLIIMGTPVLENRPCPVIEKFVLDNQSAFDKKPVSLLVIFGEKQIPRGTVEFFNYKLYNAIMKPSFVTLKKNKEQLDYEINLWFNLMEFKREELK